MAFSPPPRRRRPYRRDIVLAVALASTLALARAQVESVDADLASVIGADYSADPRGARLAPLSEGIVDAAREAGSTWKLETFSVPIGTYTLAPGRSLELVVIVDASSGDDMWFAYDTNNHKSRLTVSASASALAGSGAVLPGLVTRWLGQTRARWIFS